MPGEFKKVRFGGVEASRQWQTQLEAIGAPKRDMGVDVGLGLKAISYLGTERPVHESAIGCAVRFGRKASRWCTRQHHEVFTEGAFRDWGYKIARDFYGAVEDRRRPMVPHPRRGRPGRPAS